MKYLLILGSVLSLVSIPFTIHLATKVEPNISVQWSSATLQGIRDAKLSTPVMARALGIVHTCMYDAWAAYDDRAVGTQLAGVLRRPPAERTIANKQEAISLPPIEHSQTYYPPIPIPFIAR
jgi:hypothetical protein